MFTVEEGSAGPKLFFNGIFISSWLGTVHNETIEKLCLRLNNEINVNISYYGKIIYINNVKAKLNDFILFGKTVLIQPCRENILNKYSLNQTQYYSISHVLYERVKN